MEKFLFNYHICLHHLKLHFELIFSHKSNIHHCNFLKNFINLHKKYLVKVNIIGIKLLVNNSDSYIEVIGNTNVSCSNNLLI